MSLADTLWALAYAFGAFGLGFIGHELWLAIRPWLRLRRWRDLPARRAGIMKDWRE